MEGAYPDRLGELAEAMSEHFAHGEVWAKAARYALDAVEKAKARYAYPVAMRFAERARDAGLDVYPACPFIAEYIRRHPDRYLDLVPEKVRDKYEL